MRNPLRRVVREAEAMLTQARYLPFDLRETRRRGSGATCVLLHGLYASAGVFRPLRERLEHELKCATCSFSYWPGPGLNELSERLAGLIATIESPSPIHLIGHSLGGLVVCLYVSGPAPDPRIQQTVSLAAPFLGSARNWLVPGQAGRDITPGSVLLEQLRRGEGRRQNLPHLAIVAGEDDMILPGAYPDFGDHLLIPRAGHNGVLFEPAALSAVVERVRFATERNAAAPLPGVPSG